MRHRASFILGAALVLSCTPVSETSCSPPTDRIDIFTQAAFESNLEDENPPGLRLSRIQKPSFLACLGLQSGDRITEFNENPILDPFSASQFLSAFGKSREFTLRLESSSGETRIIVNR